jgi:hypothetical protein
VSDSPAPSRGRRCDMGCESWPPTDAYKECPVCGEPTTIYTNLYPVAEDEAESRVNHLLFEDFYENEWPSLRADFESRHPELAVVG